MFIALILHLSIINALKTSWKANPMILAIVCNILMRCFIRLCLIAVHRRKKARDRRYKQSYLYKCMFFCMCGFCNNFCGKRRNRNCGNCAPCSIQASKLFPTVGICLGTLIGIGMTLNSDPFLLFRNCRGSCDEYR